MAPVIVDVGYETGVTNQPPNGAYPRTPRSYAQTGRNNPNYRHGRGMRYRLRLEYRLRSVLSPIKSYICHAPRHLPHTRWADWPDVRPGLLPRCRWKAAGVFLTQARRVLKLWAWCQTRLLQETPAPVPWFPIAAAVVMVGAIGALPPEKGPPIYG